MSRRHIVIGLTALLGVVGVLLIPSASYAARTPRPPRVTTTTVAAALDAQSDSALAADAAPQPQAAAADPPLFTFPNFTQLFNFSNLGSFLSNIFAPLQAVLNQVFGSLCHLLGGGFCASP